MPVYDFECMNSHYTERFFSIDSFPNYIPCPDCGEPSHKIIISRRKANAARFSPIVVFKDRRGRYKFPGRSDKATPRGHERIELKTVEEVRRFERTMDKIESSRYHERMERDQQVFEQTQERCRSHLRGLMRNFSEPGKELVRECMRRNDNRPYNHRFTPNFVVDVLSFEPSNMDALHKE